MAAGDLTDAASLQRACTGVQRVLAAAHGIMGRGRWASEAVDDAGHRVLIDAARASGVKRFVYLSAYGASENHPIDFFRTKHRIEQLVRASGLDAVGAGLRREAHERARVRGAAGAPGQGGAALGGVTQGLALPPCLSRGCRSR